MYWRLADAYRQGALDGPVDETTVAQLVGLKYQLDMRGRVQTETRKQRRHRRLGSPDRADAACPALEAQRRGSIHWDVPVVTSHRRMDEGGWVPGVTIGNSSQRSGGHADAFGVCTRICDRLICSYATSSTIATQCSSVI
jgi:hypothetical protein